MASFYPQASFVVKEDLQLATQVLHCKNLEDLCVHPKYLLEYAKNNPVDRIYGVHKVLNKGQKLITIDQTFQIKNWGSLPSEYLDGYDFSGISYFPEFRPDDLTSPHFSEGFSSRTRFLPLGKLHRPLVPGEEGPALFLDRDGIVNTDHGYVSQFENIEWNEESLELIRFAVSKGYMVFIVTNQSGVAQGLYTENDVKILHREMDQFIKSSGGKITDWYYAPYSFQNGHGDYRFHSLNRKPGAGMVLEAMADYPIDLNRSLMVGDKLSDHLNIPTLRFFHLKGKYPLEEAQAPIIQSLLELKEFIA